MKYLLIGFFNVLLFPLGLSAQDGSQVRGKVTDANTGEELIGVVVTVVGTTRGTATNIDGEFTLQVDNPATATLSLSYVGYQTQQVPVNGSSFLNIKLREDIQMMDEVVVVGYGQQKKESVIGSISSIDNKELVAVPVPNLSQAIAGKLSGVSVVQPSGEIGNDEAEIYIRGMGTYGNSSPLIIVDGIIRENFSQIDPNEIQSFNVLKDASATAVYGVKGANGVIIITTRRGVEGKPRISFSANKAITEPRRIPQPLDSYEASLLWNMGQMANVQNDKYTMLDILKYRTGASPYTHPNVDWVSEVMKKTSSLDQYNLNVTGGSAFVKYFMSVGFLTQDGFYKHDDITKFSRYNFRSNLDFNISKQLTLAFNLGARIEDRHYPASAWYGSWELYRGAFATSGRDAPAYNPDGSYGGSDTQSSHMVGKIKDSGVYRNSKSVVEMSLLPRYQMDFITPGLVARAQLAYDNTGANSSVWQQSHSVYQYNLATDTYKQVGEDSYLGYSWGDSYYEYKLYLEGGLEYARDFGPHSVTGLFLGNRSDRTIGTFISYRDQGLLGRATYDFDKRYFAEVNVGYNGSENFAKGKRYGFFPAFALGWMVSNESFILNNPSLSWLSKLKLRGSLGWVGNDKVPGDLTQGDYQSKRFGYIQSYTNDGGAVFGVGDNSFSGIRQGTLADPDLTWEVARKLNVGIETSLWNDLLSINADYFYEFRYNILTDISSITPSYVGTTISAANVGKVENRGFEIELNHRKRLGQDFIYNIKGNFSYAKNKIIRKADPEGLLPYQKEEGYSIGTPLVYKYIGIFQDYEQIYNSPSQLTIPGNTEVVPGDLIFLDFNGDGIIDINDMFRQGYGTVPEIQYGVTLSFTYKNFDVSALFQGGANAQFGKNWEIMWHFSNNDNVFDNHWYYWSPETDGSEKYTRIYNKYQNNQPSTNGSTYSLGSGEYVRLKNLEVGYTLPRKFTSRIYMSDVKIFFSGNNLALWTKEPYVDPDNRDVRGGLLPQTRAYNFGININF